MPKREIRVVLLGEAGIGKSALVVRFITGRFLHKYDPTLEDEYKKEMELDDDECTLTIVDTAGQEYSQLCYHFCTADVLLIAFSLTESSTFETALKIRKLANSYCGQLSRIPAVLVGTKLDQDDMRAVGYEEGASAAKNLDCSYIETSAAINCGVVNAFTQAVRLVPSCVPEDNLQQSVYKLQPVEKKKCRSAVKSVKGFLRRCSSLSVKNRGGYSLKFMRTLSE